MAKKKEKCPYCGKEFVYLSRHKCKVKARMESKEEAKTLKERRHDRIEERKNLLTRKLTDREQEILEIINKEGDILFEELVDMEDEEEIRKLEEIIDLLALQSRIKVRRELIDASWAKHIYSIEVIDEDIEVEEVKVDKSKPDWIWDKFDRQPCFICPFTERCGDNNPDMFNPHHCPWLSEWINKTIVGEPYDVDFQEYQMQEYELPRE